MSAVDAVTAVWNRLKTVEGVGPHVYNMLREATTELDFRNLFTDTTVMPNVVRAWQVTREATAAKDEMLNAMRRIHEVTIYGYMGFQDGVSEPIFQQLIEDICAAFDPYQQPNGSALRRFVSEATPLGLFDWSGPTQVKAVGKSMFGSVAVHAAVLVYPFEEFPLY
jgi:hypothetical protein